jgi:hypothetical protein
MRWEVERMIASTPLRRMTVFAFRRITSRA